jgi:hypothetical protein
MKKFLLAFAGMASVLWTANAAETLYHTTFNSAEELQGWSVIDGNKDDSKWGYSESNDEGQRFYYAYSSTNQADDWAISPAITPKESGKLLVRYSYAGSYYSEAMKVYYGNAATVEALSQNLAADYPAIDSETHGAYFIIDAVADQPIYIGFYAYSQPNKWRLYLKELSVSTMDGDPIDLALSEIKAPVTGEGLGKEAVKVVIKNVGESSADKFDVSYSIDGGEAVTETVEHTIAKGEEYEYTFNTLADLSEARKLYTIKATVTHGSDIDSSNDSNSIQVRNYADATEPYSMGFENTEDTSRIKFFNLNEDDGDWEIAVGGWYMNLARTGNYCLAYNYNKENNADDWAILEPIKISAGYHALKFWYSGDDNHVEKLRVAYGTEPTPEAMTTTIVDLPNINKGDYQESISIFKVDQDATIYLGFYAYSDKDENWLSIDDISLDSIDADAVDMVIKNFNSLGDYVPLADYKRVTFDLYNMSINDAEATVKVYVDDVAVATKTESVLAQQTKTFTYEGLLDDVQPGTHVVKVTVENAADNNPDNNEVSKETIFLGTPDIMFDFEDGKVPDSFQFFVKDDGSLASSALAEYGETGWTTTEISTHKLYGNYMLIGSTWVNLVEDSQLDRLLVLPQIHVDSEDACFAWNVGSFNASYPVSYRVMANDGTWGDDISNKWYYDYLKSVQSQGTDRVNEGVSLADYKDKDIYVAIHLYGDPGDAIVFDNLQFHGCSYVTTGVKNITNNSDIRVSVNGDMLNVVSDSNVKSVNVYAMNGSLVASAKTANLSISALPKGVYVVKASTENATKTVKIVK